ncbi:hypothetical protein GCM10023149_50490 [Mucilaginibacter gynuensis]|uniref:Uncharacterized protein n=1 Tax=Mucilaginibacter gynuensis TaxID=1302236 RepID=A0ABP8HI10_9SPHI
MMNEQDTLGLMVMVSPVLWYSESVGKVGLIEATDLAENEVWVRFEDGDLLSFSPQILFMLRTPAELNELAENRKGYLLPPVPLELKIIAGFQQEGSAQSIREAFERLRDDPELHRWATVRLNEVLDVTPKRRIGR